MSDTWVLYYPFKNYLVKLIISKIDLDLYDLDFIAINTITNSYIPINNNYEILKICKNSINKINKESVSKVISELNYLNTKWRWKGNPGYYFVKDLDYMREEGRINEIN